MTDNIIEQQTTKNNYWGFWATLVFSVLIFIIFSIVQTLVIIGYMFVKKGDEIAHLTESESTAGFEQMFANFALNGDAIAIAEFPAVTIGIGLVLLLIVVRKTLSIKDYLKLYSPRIKHLLIFIGLMILALATMEGLNRLLERPTPEFMTQVYSTATNVPLLWLAVGVAAPIFEEILFRGFFFEGLRHSRVGGWGAILITSGIFSIIHMQYGWFEITGIFIIGILFGLAKLKTNSLYVPIAMHMFMNLAASFGMELMN